MLPKSGIKKHPPSVRRKCSVTMAFFWQGALLLSLAAAVSVYAGDTPAMYYLLTGDFWAATWALCVLSLTEMKLDCGPDSVTLVWTDSRAQADTSLFRLGSCLPTRVSVREAVFSVDINDCNFSRMVSEVVNYGKKKTKGQHMYVAEGALLLFNIFFMFNHWGTRSRIFCSLPTMCHLS